MRDFACPALVQAIPLEVKGCALVGTLKSHNDTTLFHLLRELRLIVELNL